MVASVYDWMQAQKHLSYVTPDNTKTGGEDILVRILRSLDQIASKPAVSSA